MALCREAARDVDGRGARQASSRRALARPARPADTQPIPSERGPRAAPRRAATAAAKFAAPSPGSASNRLAPRPSGIVGLTIATAVYGRVVAAPRANDALPPQRRDDRAATARRETLRAPTRGAASPAQGFSIARGRDPPGIGRHDAPPSDVAATRHSPDLRATSRPPGRVPAVAI